MNQNMLEEYLQSWLEYLKSINDSSYKVYEDILYFVRTMPTEETK